MRRGGVTAAVNAGVGDHVIMKQMRVAGTDTVRRYATVNSKMLRMASAAALCDWTLFGWYFLLFATFPCFCSLYSFMFVWPGYRFLDSVQLGFAVAARAVLQVSCLLQTGTNGVGDTFVQGVFYLFWLCFFLHCAACGRRRMSPPARHKQSLVQQDRNPDFRSGNLYFL